MTDASHPFATAVEDRLRQGAKTSGDRRNQQLAVPSSMSVATTPHMSDPRCVILHKRHDRQLGRQVAKQ